MPLWSPSDDGGPPTPTGRSTLVDACEVSYAGTVRGRSLSHRHPTAVPGAPGGMVWPPAGGEFRLNPQMAGPADRPQRRSRSRDMPPAIIPKGASDSAGRMCSVPERRSPPKARTRRARVSTTGSPCNASPTTRPERPGIPPRDCPRGAVRPAPRRSGQPVQVRPLSPTCQGQFPPAEPIAALPLCVTVGPV